MAPETPSSAGIRAPSEVPSAPGRGVDGVRGVLRYAHRTEAPGWLAAVQGTLVTDNMYLQDTELREYLTKLSPEERRILERPEDYRGLAADVARDVATTWRERLKGVLPE